MVQVHREKGFVFKINTDDHGPPHIHAWKAGHEVLINLPTRSVPASIREIRGAMKHSDIVDAVEIVEDNAARMWKKWKELHG